MASIIPRLDMNGGHRKPHKEKLRGYGLYYASAPHYTDSPPTLALNFLVTPLVMQVVVTIYSPTQVSTTKLAFL